MDNHRTRFNCSTLLDGLQHGPVVGWGTRKGCFQTLVSLVWPVIVAVVVVVVVRRWHTLPAERYQSGFLPTALLHRLAWFIFGNRPGQLFIQLY